MAYNTAGSDLLAALRDRITEPTADFFTDSQLYKYLTEGYKKLCRAVGYPEVVRAFKVTANYDVVPINNAGGTLFTANSVATAGEYQVIRVIQVLWQGKYKVKYRDYEELYREKGTSDLTADKPYFWSFYRSKDMVQISPIPTISSASSTLSGNITNSATSIALTDASSFPSRGRVYFPTTGEQVYYTGKSSNTLTGCIRGDGLTSPTAGTAGDTCEYRPLEIRMLIYPLITAIAGTTKIMTPVEYDELILHYAQHLCWLNKDKYEEARALRQLYDMGVAEAKEEVWKANFDRYDAIKDDEEGEMDFQ